LNDGLQTLSDGEQHLLELEGALGVVIIRCFLCGPWGVGLYVMNVIGLTVGLQDPHGDARVFKVLLVEMEAQFSTGYLMGRVHLVLFS
jgi:hypothetical protein